LTADAGHSADSASVVIGREELDRFAAALFEAAGVGTDDAAHAASVLVDADARGVASHGVARLPVYLDRMASGGTSPSARPVLEHERGATAVVNGCSALGLVVARFGMQHAIRLAHEYGIGAVSCRNSGHFGAAAAYARMAPDQGCVGISMTNVNVAMAPWGSISPLLGNNPIAIAAPTSGAPFVLDLALSTVARGKIRLAAASGEPIPPGWALDAEGRPTVDPHVALAGLITPLGGPKGSALAIAVDILSALLSGASTSPDVAPQAAHDRPQDVGHFFLAVHVASFVDLGTFVSRIDGMLDRIRTSTPAAGVERILAPGDLERDAELRAEQEGIRLQQSTWQALRERAEANGVTPPTIGPPR
jgi:LDH2 family malate/lactate/ureidoglycolate dehydrogenase